MCACACVYACEIAITDLNSLRNQYNISWSACVSFPPTPEDAPRGWWEGGGRASEVIRGSKRAPPRVWVQVVTAPPPVPADGYSFPWRAYDLLVIGHD